MAHSDKNIVITPNIGSNIVDPQIVFSGADASLGPQNITLKAYPTSNGTLSFEGSAGQLFSITNDLTGTIFSVNDVSGIPSIEVLGTGLVKLAQYSGNVLVASGTDNGTDKLQVNGSIAGTVLKSSIATGNAPFTIASTTRVANLNVATAGTADTLTTARTINGVSFNGSANITIESNTTNALTIGTGLSGTSFNGSSAVTVAIDSTVATLTGTQTLTNKTLTSPTLTTPALGTPSSGNLANCTFPTLNQNTTGNATTATTLQTARTINGTSFDGSANIVAPTNLGVTAGNTAGPIITSSSGTSATIPSASGTASGVVTTGTQTFAGAKTFTNTTINGTTLIGRLVADNSQSGIGNGFGASNDGNQFYAFTHIFYSTDSENGGLSSELMRLTFDGDLGIGVSNPSHKLSVAGTGNFTGTVTAPTFTGSVTTRISSSATNTSVTPNTASFDMIAFTALASALAINAPTGSPTNGTKLLFRILDDGTARALTWDGTYIPIGVTLPTTTVVSKTVYVGCIYNANNTRWDVIAVTTQA